MSIEVNITQVRALLVKLSQYEQLILSESFSPDTIADMKTKAKVLCDETKIEMDDIKSKIDQWT